ncbi:putative cytochrome P450 family protein [Zopfia rhizophila CBS 207.26]|uniref:Putative cytochrome P450 family protein n=1 Tax=Zopfia rhizophila CBS 207.26 TaxID=1314779 RepID=A0A6A6EEB4_9PEZI|nr:putative cytochrome P450 family protein [Zopfia rhizophila CBS 207.26]
MQTELIVGAALLIAIKVVVDILNHIQHAAKARRLGCKPPPNRTSLAFGIDHILQMTKADWDMRLPNFFIKTFEKMRAQEGRPVYTLRKSQLGEASFLTCDPKNIQAILASQFHDFDFGDIRRNAFHGMLGTGIFAADGKLWERSRALLRPQFSRDQISDLDLEERHVQNAMQAIPVSVDGWTDVVDLQTIFFRLTLDTSTEFLFGESVESQIRALQTQDNNDEALSHVTFSQEFDRSQWYLSSRVRLQRLYWMVDTRAFRHSIKVVHEYVDRFVHKALAGMPGKSDETLDGEKPKYVFLGALAEQTKDPLELRSQSLSIMLAGRDTTASLLSWFFRFMIEHPSVYHKLRNIVMEEFGSYREPRNITFASLKACRYLQFCMNETLRLNPVVSLNVRAATKDTTLPRGGGEQGLDPVYVRKGQMIMYSIHVTHRLKEYWGEDANDFKPQRWEGLKHGWEYLPFNGGPRICLGQQFALTEAAYVIVRLLQRFDRLEGVDHEKEVRTSQTLTSAPADLVKVRMHEAA